MLSILRVAAVVFFGAATAQAQSFQMSKLAEDTDLGQFVLRIEGLTPQDEPYVLEYPVTDIKLEILQHEGDAQAALNAENLPERGRNQWIFAIALDVVADGKLFRNGIGMCSTWADDIAYCAIEDDGGRFLLTRHLQDDLYDLTITLRPFPEIFADDTHTAIALDWDGMLQISTSLDVTNTPEGSFTFVHPARW